MTISRPQPGRLVSAVAAASAPGLLALALLVAAGRLAAWPATLAGLGMILGLAFLIGLHLSGLEALARQWRSIAARADSPEKAPPVAKGERPLVLAPELAAAASEAERAWSARRQELEAIAAARHAVLESLPDPLLLLESGRRILRANRAAEAVLGPGLGGRDLVAVLRNPPVIEAVDRVLAGGAGATLEFSLPLPVERIFSARIEPLPARIANGSGALIALHDVTRMKRADQMRADFVANASHELRTPLSTLLGFIETLQGPARDDAEARDRFLAIMREQAARMSRLVADLLSLSRIELDEHSPPTGRIDLQRVLGSVADALQVKAAGKSMTIALAPDLAELPPVLGDADELAQLFQNLIDNAVKYGRSGTTVRVEGRFVPAGSPGPRGARTLPAPRRLAGDAVAITVADEGEGIAREHLSRLTERFYRIDTARSRDLGGTGLGLAIVKHIVNRHRGALEIDSTVGKGSAFTVYLPAAAGSSSQSGNADAKAESRPAS